MLVWRGVLLTGTCLAVTSVARQTAALEGSVRVETTRVLITIVGLQGALVNI